MSYRLVAAAQYELAQTTRWYLDEAGVRIAASFVDNVHRAAHLLSHSPQLGTHAYPGIRIWPIKRFPHTLVYRVEADGICVLALAHQSREPGYWRGR